MARYFTLRGEADLLDSHELLKGLGGISRLNLSFELRLDKKHTVVCKNEYLNNRSVNSSRFDFVKIRNDSDEPWFGQVLLFIVSKREKEEDTAESLVLIRNLQVVRTQDKKCLKVRGMLSLEWQYSNFEAGLNFVPVKSIESKVLIAFLK
jgi:hypothetical protein